MSLIVVVLPFASSAFAPAGVRWFAEHQPFTPVIRVVCRYRGARPPLGKDGVQPRPRAVTSPPCLIAAPGASSTLGEASQNCLFCINGANGIEDVRSGQIGGDARIPPASVDYVA